MFLAVYNCCMENFVRGVLPFLRYVFQVDLGYCKIANRVSCPHPHNCAKLYVDHGGFWNVREGFDSLLVPDNSLPATRVAEWCVADADRVRVVGHRIHRFTKRDMDSHAALVK